jgi:hypothetical protein
MIECSIFAGGMSEIQPFKDCLEELGCNLRYFHQLHKIFQKGNLRIRLVKTDNEHDKVYYLAAPDSNSSLLCNVQQIEETKVYFPASTHTTVENFLDSTLGFAPHKEFSVAGFGCKLESVSIDCFQTLPSQGTKGDWIIKMSVEKLKDQDVAYYENKLWSFTRFFKKQVKFHNIDSLYIR